MDNKTKIGLIRDEYFQLQKMLEEFDGKALTIKAWSVTLSAAGIVTAYAQTKPMVLLVAAASSLIFWLVEGVWKVNQQAFYPRVWEIENNIYTSLDKLEPLKIATFWSHQDQENRRTWYLLKVLRWPHVFLPHILVALAGIALYFLAPPMAAS